MYRCGPVRVSQPARTLRAVPPPKVTLTMIPTHVLLELLGAAETYMAAEETCRDRKTHRALKARTEAAARLTQMVHNIRASLAAEDTSLPEVPQQ